MSKKLDIKDIYVKKIRKELERMLKMSKKNGDNNSPTDYVYRSGIITGLEKAINVIEKYE